MLQVAVNYRVVKNNVMKRKAPLLCSQWRNNYVISHTRPAVRATERSSDTKIKPNDSTKHYYNCEKNYSWCNLLGNRHEN